MLLLVDRFASIHMMHHPLRHTPLPPQRRSLSPMLHTPLLGGGGSRTGCAIYVMPCSPHHAVCLVGWALGVSAAGACSWRHPLCCRGGACEAFAARRDPVPRRAPLAVFAASAVRSQPPGTALHAPRGAGTPSEAAILLVAPDDHVTTSKWTEQLVRRAQQKRQATDRGRHVDLITGTSGGLQII